MKVDIDIAKLINVDDSVKQKLKEYEKQIKSLEQKVSSRNMRIEELEGYKTLCAQAEHKYNVLKNKVKEFLSLGDE